MKHIKTFENFQLNENKDFEHVGIDWQSDFSMEEKEIIETEVQERIADMVVEDYTNGELSGEEPDYSGWWQVDIDDEYSNDESALEVISDKIRGGYTSGIDPTFSWSANVWK